MRALVLDKELRLIEDYPIPEPPPGEALVRVSVAGICNTDLELVKGYMQFRARYPLSDALTAFEHAARSGTLKVLVDFPPLPPS